MDSMVFRLERSGVEEMHQKAKPVDTALLTGIIIE